MKPQACLALALLLAGCAAQAPIAPVPDALSAAPPKTPAVGDTAVYRVINVYNGEARGEVRFRVDKVERDRIIVAGTSATPAAGFPREEIYTADGNWLRRALASHNQVVDYDFAPAYPAYPLPLEQGKSWSVRVSATNPATGKSNSVRVDGEVLGSERIVTPAGAFDTIKVRRRVYAGDWDGFLHETNIVEVDWYSPELGRAVRSERNSGWLDLSRSPGGGGMLMRNDQWMRGDWDVFELVSYGRN